MPLLSVPEAQALVLANAPAPEVIEVDAPDARGCVLAEDVAAPEDLPAFDNSAMDGYAVRAEDTAGAAAEYPRCLRLVDTIPAGRRSSVHLEAGTAAAIMTGAPVPPGADAVVEQEAAAADGTELVIRRAVRPGEHVRRAGEDVRRGGTLLAAGTPLVPAAIALLAAAGRVRVRIYRAPRTAVIATGSELVPPGETPPPGHIRDSNGWMLAAALADAGAPPAVVLRATDSRENIRGRLEAAWAARPDLVLLSGGVSVGGWDFVKEALEHDGVRPLFWRVAQKPGKPLFAGRRERTLVLGLPGNPASALVCFYEYAYPAVRKARGFARPGLEAVAARLAAPVRPARDRTQFLRAHLESGPDGWTVRAEAKQGSHLLVPFARADALSVIPPGEAELAAGARVTVHRLPAPC